MSFVSLFVHWNVDPEIFNIGGFAIRWYGLLFMLGFVLSYQILKPIFKKENVSVELLDKLSMYIGIGTIVGARLGHCLFYEPDYYLAHPVEILMIQQGGLASHGGAIGIILALWLFVRKYKIDHYAWWIDRLAIVIPLSGALIRLGNLMNSEIFGLPTEKPWGFYFERLPLEIASVPHHPTQIYEATFYFLCFGIMAWLFFKKKAQEKPWFMFGVLLVLIFGFRIVVEFWKEDQEGQQATAFFNLGQLLSIPFIIIGFYLIFKALKRNSN